MPILNSEQSIALATKKIFCLSGHTLKDKWEIYRATDTDSFHTMEIDRRKNDKCYFHSLIFIWWLETSFIVKHYSWLCHATAPWHEFWTSLIILNFYVKYLKDHNMESDIDFSQNFYIFGQFLTGSLIRAPWPAFLGLTLHVVSMRNTSCKSWMVWKRGMLSSFLN